MRPNSTPTRNENDTYDLSPSSASDPSTLEANPPAPYNFQTSNKQCSDGNSNTLLG
ncbi:uncharacterized protein LACBIDRAFT_298362 [Laccaria bicolor S238N-H82]|uniref:Predicted protein n=1 Tax=Laccaria bicolor (strain S238N-H82 / ATCC MYA-4686) TaxID=486041 RepID=B0E3C8_LACBS|nr:uncharacterized protein LACBIDRAFT_298362 [Laccaria bicolor S238N-H82]EDQ98651.1 predicted protein [Laccaria bicolor S238N-H82]|eukprot:XP_001890698.1 predicted protein [Laccaria bicolor S238N-H82]